MNGSPQSISPAELARLRAGVSEVTLDGIVRAARAAWPGVAVDEARFVTHLVRHLPAGGAVADALAAMCTSDLYLACGCVDGDAAALAAFDRCCLGVVDGALARRGLDGDVASEVKQRIRQRVLVADGGPPRIAGYSGRGELVGWVRVMAVREALAVERQHRRERPVEDEALLHAWVAPGDPESDHLQRHYRAEFRQAFDGALRQLPAREQTLLRQHVLDGLTIDQLAALYRVHRATAARSVERARQELWMETRRRMRTRLRVGSAELDSILRLIRSRLEISLRGLMARGRRARRSGG